MAIVMKENTKMTNFMAMEFTNTKMEMSMREIMCLTRKMAMGFKHGVLLAKNMMVSGKMA